MRCRCETPILATSFICWLRLFDCCDGLRDQACQNVKRCDACAGVEFRAYCFLNARGRLEKCQGPLHGDAPYRLRAPAVESGSGREERRRSSANGANRLVERGMARGVVGAWLATADRQPPSHSNRSNWRESASDCHQEARGAIVVRHDVLWCP